MIVLSIALAVAAPAVDWAAALRRDAQAMHDDISVNHPGPVNPLDPKFSKRNEGALALALRRAKQVHDYSGYYYALSGYAASFDDDHLYVEADEDNLPASWPSFLTAYEDGAQIVTDREKDAPVPLGARLVSCDGIGADRLVARNVGAFVGQWFLPATRVVAVPKLFVDFGNPFVPRPRSCKFVSDGTQHEVTLRWRPIATADAWKRIDAANRRVYEPIGAKVLRDGTRWFTISSFSGNPLSVPGKSLTALVAGMTRDRAAIAAAPRVVFDLRGNGGGSSDWSDQIAAILWGRGRIDAIAGSGSVDWRASRANLTSLEEYKARLAQGGPLADRERQYFDRLLVGMVAAIRERRAYWRAIDPIAAVSSERPPESLRGPVYFLTDSACVSACLDAADLWSALGAIQIGRETGADTLYMDDRRDKLPSGNATLSLPMKVYRGRPRGANQPLRPKYIYPDDMRDTDAIARWIATLPESRRKGRSASKERT